ncbi:MAG TPA: ATP-binding protein [Candidatus Saccharimonadales bacterium]
MSAGKKFDPATAPFEMHRHETHNGELLTQENMLLQFHRSSSGVFPIIYGEYEGPIASTELVLSKKHAGNDSQWLYKGEVTLRDDGSFDQDNFFRLVERYAGEVDGLVFEDFYFSNNRLFIAEKSGALACLSTYRGDKLIRYSNYHESRSTTHKEISSRLTAPKIYEDLDGKVGLHFVSHVSNFMMITNAISQLVDGRPKFERLAVTSKRTYYATKEGEFMPDPPEWEASGHRPGGHSEMAAAETLLLEDVAGHDDLRLELKKLVTAFKHPEIMAQWGVESPKGVYLYGPPGTGKSMLARALANEVGGNLWEIHSPDIYDKWLGNSEKNLQKIFKDAHKITKPTVMLWDEFDGLIESGSDDGNSHAVERVAALFKKEVEKLRKNPNVILFAITNNPDKVNESLVREGRFDISYYVDLPNQATRLQILANHIAAKTAELSTGSFSIFGELDLPELSKVTEGMSGAAIVTALQRAAFDKAMQQANGQTPGPITQQNALGIINMMKRS